MVLTRRRRLERQLNVTQRPADDDISAPALGHEPTVVDDRFPAFQHGIDGSKPRATVGARVTVGQLPVFERPRSGDCPGGDVSWKSLGTSTEMRYCPAAGRNAAWCGVARPKSCRRKALPLVKTAHAHRSRWRAKCPMCERPGHRALRGAPSVNRWPSLGLTARLQPLKRRRPMLRSCRPGRSATAPAARAAPRPIAPAARSCHVGTGRPPPRSVLRAVASIRVNRGSA